MQYPSTAATKDLDAKHQDYINNERVMKDLCVLYKGGELMRKHMRRFLVQGTKEITGVYENRLKNATYNNLLASIVVWYVSKLYETPLTFSFRQEQEDEAGPAGNTQGPAAAKKVTAPKTPKTPPFYANLQNNCDRAGTPIEKFFETLTADALVYSDAYFLIDLPRLSTEPLSLAEQESLGALDAYFVRFDPSSVINWSKDEFGSYEWVTLKTTQEKKDSFLGATNKIQRWAIYDRTTFGIYEAVTPPGKETKVANLILTGNHALADQQQVPLMNICADDRLALGFRCVMPLINYLNTENKYSWALDLINNPIPVFMDGDGDTKFDTGQTVAPYAGLTVPKGGSATYLEPQGKAWQASENRLAALKDQIFSSCHLLAQAKTSKGSDYQSGLSKEIMMSPAVDVCNILGSLMTTAIQNALELVSAIRGDNVSPSVMGMNFADDMSGEVASLVLELQSINVPSPTFMKEMHKKLIHTCIPDMDADLSTQCDLEVDTAVLDTPEPKTAVNLNMTERGTLD